MVEQAGQRRVLPVLVMSSGELAGVGAQQVVHAVPARPGVLDQVRAGQRVQCALGLLDGRAGERGGGIAVKVKAGVQAH